MSFILPEEHLNLYSSYNSSSLHPNILSTNSTSSDFVTCFLHRPQSLIFIAFCLVNIILLLPSCIFILHHGFQQWIQNVSVSSAVRHSDCFTHHMAILELNSVVGCFICFIGISGNFPSVASIGYSMYAFTCVGETFFHLLMCLEHYLAVVYPITYMGLRKDRGIQIRNICIFCTWLLCFTMGGLMQIISLTTVLTFVLSITALIINSLCCLSVLCVLINPGPGKLSGNVNRREKFKYRAFYTILAILGVLVFRFLAGLTWVLQTMITGESNCFSTVRIAWFNLPSSLVQPLLFLQRAGLFFCPRVKNN